MKFGRLALILDILFWVFLWRHLKAANVFLLAHTDQFQSFLSFFRLNSELCMLCHSCCATYLLLHLSLCVCVFRASKECQDTQDL